MMTDFHVVIPARYQSSRLPGKLMMKIADITVIERVYRQAVLAKPKSIVIATDNDAIATHAETFGAKVMMTSIDHQSGTDRIAEVVRNGEYREDDIIVNVQGDEPFIAPELIRQVADSLAHAEAPMATLCWPLGDLEQLYNPNVVKVVRNQFNNALYFSRSPVPAHREDKESLRMVYKHIGLYAYRADFLLQLTAWPPCELERLEALEQLRVLWAGYTIRVDEACVKPLQDINTADDLQLAREFLTA
ncbi:3-deoxy-manno-octulosonate cytidylyltransferase [Legionella taurinensis]|uniref:3-deoxy-manno-octulosonate cytidylyltransferase n=1 Tax=Legionella taurinensis TaxID=70611 RepID=A0A3A5LX14_9GAMM|nr:3-deoxy-manno-octulosonate cytidylyltransferase [Legionella taurinensis]MDX1837399.1 3-deoxy-manno-octulosonate cytidylyltransferase [Legionella taurinensis]PUT40748.1 3-deoxy-manno-octulosonate cytidylyltransferase [Legionella taurinensis]PUT44170.1 3-deoxy-manno-octulosonate cytidylyltransferase [Legionella taurinensis]PUT47471.1 3-deoxy-manno-octulosonate cytidylyltransferase [Legionella taurinensis]PUT48610.1 3-deoxy-manno-octulosonate cytidylyltransferase [Legionella taurinensis]